MTVVLIVVIVILALLLVGALLGLALQLLWWALVGLVIGALARLVVPGTQELGILPTVLFGVGGALLGGIAANVLDVGSILEFLIAVVVAAVLILTLGAGRRTAT